MMRARLLSFVALFATVFALIGAQARPAFGWCAAMGGYPSFEAQARAQERARARVERRREVKADQTALKGLGYYSGAIDGQTSPGLSAAVRSFRRENGLGPGSDLDAASRRLLGSGSAKPLPEGARKASAARQQQAEDERALQRLGYLGNVDGAPSKADLRVAIVEFRKANGFEAGTKLDARTREKLHAGAALSKSTWQTLEERKLTIQDQEALADLGLFNGRPDGYRSAGYTTAIRQFKQQHGFDAADGALNDASRAALRAAQVERAWLRSGNGDGVAVFKMDVARDGAGYRLKTAEGDFSYDAAAAAEVKQAIEKALADPTKVRRVYVDVSAMPPERVRAFEAALEMTPASPVRFIRQSDSSEILFSTDVELGTISPVVQTEGGRWLSTVTLSRPKPTSAILRIMGKTRELTSAFVNSLRGVHARAAKSKKTLGGSLNRVRESLKEDKKIENDDELIIELQKELSGIETAGVPAKKIGPPT